MRYQVLVALPVAGALVCQQQVVGRVVKLEATVMEDPQLTKETEPAKEHWLRGLAGGAPEVGLAALPTAALAAALLTCGNDETGLATTLLGGAVAARCAAAGAAAFAASTEGASTTEALKVFGMGVVFGGWTGAVQAARAPTALEREIELDEAAEPLQLGSNFWSGSDDALLMTMDLEAKPGQGRALAALLTTYMSDIADPSAAVGEVPVAAAANQISPRDFVLTVRFKAGKIGKRSESMALHHASPVFLKLVESARPLLANSIGLYVVDQNDGVLGNSRYPFGPGGEGGRDDAIYSSPSNLDGSQVGSKLGIEVERHIDLDVFNA